MATSASSKRAVPTLANGVPLEESTFVRKKLKLSDIPITATKRKDIDALLHKFKKKGEFDKLRKQIYAEFIASDAKNTMLQSLDALTDAEIDRDPYLLSKSRQNATALIEGAAERSDVYKAAGVYIEQLLSKYISSAEESMRDIRISDVGEERAREEQQLGSKTEEDYEREAHERKAERTRVREEAHEAVRQKELAAKKKADEERRRRREEEKEREREREEIDAKRRKEREEEYEREREERRERRRREDERYREREDRYRDHRDRDRSRSRDRTRDRSRTRSRERHRDKERTRDTRDRERDRDRSRRQDDSRERTKPRASSRRRRSVDSTGNKSPIAAIVTEKDLEEAALKELLKEGELAARSRSRFESDKTELPGKPSLSKTFAARDNTLTRSAKGERPAGETRASSRAASQDRSPGVRPRHRDHDTNGRRDRNDRRRSPLDAEATRRRSRSGSSTRRTRDHDRAQSRGHSRDKDDDRRSRMLPPQGDRYIPGVTTTTERPERRYDSYRAENSRRRSTSRRRSQSRGRQDDRKARDDSRSRSRRRSARRESREKSRDRPAVKRTRDPSPTGIDRYIPGGARKADRDTSHGRTNTKDQDEDRKRDTRRDRDSSRTRNDDRTRDRDLDRRRDRSRERDRPLRREYETYRPDASDRYLPKSRGREDDKDRTKPIEPIADRETDSKVEEGEVRDKPRERSRSRPRGKRHDDRPRARARSRSRSRSHDRRQRDSSRDGSRDRRRRRSRSRDRSRRRARSDSRDRRDRHDRDDRHRRR